MRKREFARYLPIAVVLALGVAWTYYAIPAGVPLSSLGADWQERQTDISQPILHEYIEVVGGCGPYYRGDPCVRAYAGPGDRYPVVGRLRKGVVLRVESVLGEMRLWYKVVFDEGLRYPERARREYIRAGDVRHFWSDGVRDLVYESASTTKRIIVDRSEQKLYAYEGEEPFMEAIISTGLELTPTPRGILTIYKKTPTRYMQGHLPGISDQYYDLPGVPWNLYFTPEGGVIHGAYWHNSFGRRWSHGCVNLSPYDAQKLYEWADIGTKVLVRD